MSKRHNIWENAPAKEDYPAAHDYLSLVFDEKNVKRLISTLRRAGTVTRAAKDLLRASNLPLLAQNNPHVAADLKKIRKKRKLSPVLLVRGDASRDVPMVIADGYHRICASWYFDENGPIACRLVDGE